MAIDYSTLLTVFNYNADSKSESETGEPERDPRSDQGESQGAGESDE